MAIEQTVEIGRPNNVLAKAMLRGIDMIRPRLQASRPERVAFCVSTRRRSLRQAPWSGSVRQGRPACPDASR